MNNVFTITAYPGLLPPEQQSTNQSQSQQQQQQQDPQQPQGVEITYTDLKTIGNGSFGVVYQATLQRPTHEQVAIKKVLQDKRFKNRELQIMRRLDHCNVVKLKYFFHTNGDRGSSEVYLHLVLEYIPETLYKIARTHSRNRQNLPMILVKLYMYQLFRSLNYIHSMDICHRDIKPQNLLLNPETGVLKLCDFGSAKSLVGGEPNVAYICSRYYRAPELIFGATDYTTKIDIWSAGCVMAELILGEPMFPGESGVDQLVEIIKILGTPTREQMRAMNPHYTEFRFPVIKARSWNKIFSSHFRTPPEAASLVSKLLEYTPYKRFTPLEACRHPFFNELRSDLANRKLPNGREFPPLFNFSDDELISEPHLISGLLPQSHQSQQISDPMSQQPKQQNRNTSAPSNTTAAPEPPPTSSSNAGGSSGCPGEGAQTTLAATSSNASNITNNSAPNTSNQQQKQQQDDSSSGGVINGREAGSPGSRAGPAGSSSSNSGGRDV